MEFNGERYIPEHFENIDDEIVYEHENRYMAISKNTNNQIVLDAACGTGYGTLMLSKYAKKVVGIDIDLDLIKSLQDKYKDIKNIEFVNSSIEKLPFEDDYFDKVISFETIEHVNENIQKNFLLEIKRVLKNNGILIMSTPDKYLYSDLPKYKNEFHIKEFYSSEYYDFLNLFFTNIKFYYQIDEIVNIIYADSSNTLDINKSIKDEIKGKYIIAVCSNLEIKNEVISSSVIINTQLQKLKTRILELQKEVKEKNKWAFELSQKVEEYSHRILELQKEVEEKNKWAFSLTDQIDERDKELSQIKDEINALKQELTDMYISKSWKLTRGLRRFKRLFR